MADFFTSSRKIDPMHVPNLLEKEWTPEEHATAAEFLNQLTISSPNNIANFSILATGRGNGVFLKCIRGALIAAKSINNVNCDTP